MLQTDLHSHTHTHTRGRSWLRSLTATYQRHELSVQHIRIGLASLSSQTMFKNEVDSIWNERLSYQCKWDNLQPT